MTGGSLQHTTTIDGTKVPRNRHTMLHLIEWACKTEVFRWKKYVVFHCFPLKDVQPSFQDINFSSSRLASLSKGNIPACIICSMFLMYNVPVCSCQKSAFAKDRFSVKRRVFAYKLQFSRNITVKKQYSCNIDMTFCKGAFPHWFLQRASAPRKGTLHFFEEKPLLLWRNTTPFSITKFTPFWTECRKRCDTFFEEYHILSKRVLHTSEALHFTSPPNLESKGSNKFSANPASWT